MPGNVPALAHAFKPILRIRMVVTTVIEMLLATSGQDKFQATVVTLRFQTMTLDHFTDGITHVCSAQAFCVPPGGNF